MDPDVLLREFSRPAAGPASNLALRRRVTLTESLNAWDDAGSALLIDRRCLVETQRHSAQTMGRHSRSPMWGCF